VKLQLPSIILSCLLLALLPLSGNSYPQAQTRITEGKILEILNSMDKAAKNKNIAGVVADMAKDIQIKLIVEASGKAQEINLDLDKYIFYTRRGFRRRTTYVAERQNMHVTISGDGKTAMLTDDLYETVTMAEGTIQSVTAEIAIFKLGDDGHIAITSLEGRLHLR
jgi:Cft2 family RNA processing exonuclease